MKITDIKPKQNRKKLVLISVITVFVCLGMGVFFVVFPDTLNRKHLINIQYMDDGKAQRVITLYESVSNSDDGSYLTGYWLYVCDPITNKELNKIFIKRRDKNNDLPTTPNMYAIGNEIWIVGDKGIYAGDVGFLAVLKVINDKPELISNDFLRGYTISGSYMWENTLTVVNQYSETGCLNMKTHQVSAACEEAPADSSLANSSTFFFLKNTASSTRGHLYYYSSSKPLPQPGIYAGYSQQGVVIPGWHLIDHIKMQRGFIMKEDMDAYVAQFDSSEKVVAVYEKEFMNNPNILYSDNKVCVLTSSEDPNTGKCTFYEFSADGKLIWKVECPELKKQTYAGSFLCYYKPKETIIRHPQNWVLSINNTDGKINWQYPR
jgi:hypothetical protein